MKRVSSRSNSRVANGFLAGQRDPRTSDLTHNEPGLQPLVHATTVFTVRMFATLLQSLKAIPEGAGNLLDLGLATTSCTAIEA